MVKQRTFILALLFVFLLSNNVLAQEPAPPDIAAPPDPVTTETSTYEWMTVETDEGEERVLVHISSIESLQREKISVAESRATTRDYTFEMWRALAWYYSGWPIQHLYVYAKGRTTTSVVADWIYVFIQHERCDPGDTCVSGQEWTWTNVDNDENTELDSTQAYKETHRIVQNEDQEHAAWGHHQAQVNGEQ
jgi:hypothetical protein